MLENSQKINLRAQEEALFKDINTLIDLKDGAMKATGEHSPTFTRLLNHIANKDNSTYTFKDYVENSEFITRSADEKLEKLLGKDYSKKLGTVETQTQMYKYLSGAQSTLLPKLKTLPRIKTPTITNSIYPIVRETEVSGDNQLFLKGGKAYKTLSLLRNDPSIQENLISKYSENLSSLSIRKREAPKIAIGEHAIIIDYQRHESSLGYLVEKTESGFKFKSTFYVSASAHGTGFGKTSNQTPTGSFAILPKYSGTVLTSGLNKSIRPFNEYGYREGSSLFMTAKFALSGLDKENLGSVARGIALHGSPLEDSRFSLKGSIDGTLGCPVPTNEDIFELGKIIVAQHQTQKEQDRPQAFRVEITATKPT